MQKQAMPRVHRASREQVGIADRPLACIAVQTLLYNVVMHTPRTIQSRPFRGLSDRRITRQPRLGKRRSEVQSLGAMGAIRSGADALETRSGGADSMVKGQIPTASRYRSAWLATV